ncbi:cation-translocating P-type ATPase [Herminiimonas sp. CN]|uniref:heavy metal translocating P-type ATPase n=1 Tax=Herminiimonas sp. CN TaxID=1349818 RepID=UPI000473AE00|nr:cation-translocating P-type ATPase [Herminiimonas sp. CN]
MPNSPSAAPASLAPAAAEAGLKHEKLAIDGIRCAACVQLIEFRLQQLAGVTAFKLNIASHRADISWDSRSTSLPRIVEAISDLGYSALPAGSQGVLEERAKKMALWRLFVAGFAMMQVMMYAFPAYLVPVAAVDGDLTPDIDRLLKLASLAITVPVVLFCAWPFFRAAWRDLRNRHVGMDVPVSVGVLVTFFASVWATFAGGPVYYDSLIMFVFLLLAARTIEAKVHRKSTSALRALIQLVPAQAEKIDDYPHSRQTVRVAAEALRAGDFILVPAGAHIPVDGVVIEGASECDEALMTGESHPVIKSRGSKLIGGALNLIGPLVMQAEQVGDQTQLSSLVKMMEAAANEKPPLVALADRHASRFLLAIMLLAIAAGIVWWQIDPARALWIAVTIIIVTCPCALSLATPGVMSAAVGRLARNGVLVARGRAIESLARTTHVVFDKTGTLTQGKLHLLDTLLLRRDAVWSVAFAQAAAARLAAGSLHPVSLALAGAPAMQQDAFAIPEFDGVREIAGAGLQAGAGDQTYRLGSVDFVQQLHRQPLEIPPQYAGQTLAAFGDAGGWIALFVMQDGLRHDARDLITFLLRQGKKVVLLSGDRADVVAQVGRELGIAEAFGELGPAQKYDAIKKIQQQGGVVAMIGDGMNDGPGLSLADVSIAMGQGAPISQARSDVILISSHLGDLRHAFQTAAKAMLLIRQNLGWALLYNAIAIPAAMSGLLAPWHAAVGMSLSSLAVVLNSLRISSQKTPQAGLNGTMAAVARQAA